MRRFPQQWAAALAIGTLLLGACSDGDPDEDTATAESITTTTTTSRPSSTTSTSVSPTTEVTPESTDGEHHTASEHLSEVGEADGPAAVEILLYDLLIAASEVGDPSFTDEGYGPPDVNGSSLCGTPLVDAASESTALVGTNLRSTDLGQSIQQELRVYESEDQASAAWTIMTDGLSCPTSTDGKVTLTSHPDPSADVDGDQATLVTATSAGNETIYYIVRVADVVISLSVSATVPGPPIPATATPPSTQDLIRFAVGKVRLFLENG